MVCGNRAMVCENRAMVLRVSIHDVQTPALGSLNLRLSTHVHVPIARIHAHILPQCLKLHDVQRLSGQDDLWFRHGSTMFVHGCRMSTMLNNCPMTQGGKTRWVRPLEATKAPRR